MQVSELDALQAGRAAHARHAWDEAFTLLRDADATAPLEPPDLERLAEDARWSGHFADWLDALERAQGEYEASGRLRDGARVALELAFQHWERTEDALAGGWQSRATRLLEQLDEGPEHVRLRLAHAHMLLRDGQVEPAAEIAREVVESGRRMGDQALEGLGLVNLGHALLAAGQVEEAVRHIDEASTLALTGGLDLETTGTIFCATIFACRNSGDWRRAGEWAAASLRWCARNSVNGFPGICRFHRSEVLRMRGEFADAEQEVRAAIEEMQLSAPRIAQFGFGELGEIKRRQGDRDAATAAFRRCAELGGDPQPGWALLRAADGDAAGALRTLGRTLAAGDALVRDYSSLLGASVAVALVVGDLATARDALATLEDHAVRAGNPGERAGATTASGHLAVADGRNEEAIAKLRQAVAAWFEMHAPFEAARARLLLAAALRAAGDEGEAGIEGEAALATLERIGASMDLEPGISAAGAAAERALMTFMFTDMVGSTRLLDELGDDGWNELLGHHDALVRARFLATGGQEIKHEGDGFFVAFSHAEDAVEAGCEIQRGLAEDAARGGGLPPVRIGIHTASATSRRGDFVGRGVHEAARLAAAADGDEVLVSRRTLEAAGGRFEGCRPREIRLQGFRDPIGVVTVPWRGDA